ncbi:uncharacterized protein LOC117173027 [Belonocnema kinseyi]|uniref:uncharacterized protein LOC117173027 n=1 Tax=Belonocnema kinseyi TaxID=2817044 RepID=UPI00143E018D|nr:uncharacterized protein LOC117173027 [Belonocnema kinseyi]
MTLRFQKSIRNPRRRGSKTPLCKNSVTLEATPYLHPYMESASWLYLDTDPTIPIDQPVMHPHNLDYAMPPPRRKTNCSQFHHCRHRRVVSDPGFKNWNIAEPSASELKKHRRVSSFNEEAVICLEESMNKQNQEYFFSEDTRTSTFRKVPWHPYLHMLKIRPS